MRLRKSRVPQMANKIVNKLVKEEDILVELENVAEVKLDIEAVFTEYIHRERQVNEKAKDLVEEDRSGNTNLPKMRRLVAREMRFKVGDDAIEFLAEQIVQTFMNSPNTDDVFSEDNTIRKKVADILKFETNGDALDEEVRKRIQNLQEGTQNWEVEYGKVREQIKRVRGE